MRALLILATVLLVAGPASAANVYGPRSEADRKLDAMLSRKHPDGKGPSSTSSSRGYYKGTGGRWHLR